MACEDIKARLASLEELYAETTQELRNLGPRSTPEDKSSLLQELKQMRAQIAATKRELELCLKREAQPDPVAAPRNVLEIKYTNPQFNPAEVSPNNPDWAATIAGGTFPDASGKEWTQVLAPEDEYDKFTLVGATGWAMGPRLVSVDFPFSHPFGFDWEFDFALDPEYSFLLAPGNMTARPDKIQRANDFIGKTNDLQTPLPGLLGVEWDRGHVPPSFRSHVGEGDRVAVFGRWIVDTGHDDPFRTEIHPPLLMASARTQKADDGSQGTRVLFTSRPYLVGQRFTVDTDDIYDDQAEDDGHFYEHILREVLKVNKHRSLLVQAHPKIKSHPFLGAHLAHFIIRPPEMGDSGPLGSGVANTMNLVVSYQFTVRSGCTVQVTATSTDTIDVFISMSHGGFTPPPLPHRKGVRFSREELRALDEEAADKYLDVEKVSAAVQLLLPGSIISSAAVSVVFERGIETDEYSPLKEVNILDSSRAVSNVSVNNIPAGAGISVDDSQPFPVFGWLEAKWVPRSVLQP